MKYNITSLRIRKNRLDLGLTQEELAQKTKITLGALKTYETGTRLPSKKSKIKLCEFFHISLEELEGEKEKNELKEYLISILDIYNLDSKKFTILKKIMYDFWEQCFTLYEISNFNIDSILKCFIIEHKKTSTEHVKVNRDILNTLSQDTKILDIAEKILNSTITFFYNIMYGEYEQAIFKNSVIEYLSYILLYLCISNYYMIVQALKEISISSPAIKYFVPLIENISANIEKNTNHCNNFIELATNMKKENTKHIAIRIDNDEMSFKYENGNIVIIELKNDFKNSQDILVSIDNQAPILRRIIQNENGIILQPLNASYYPQSFTKTEIKNGTIKVLGVVVQVFINQDT